MSSIKKPHNAVCIPASLSGSFFRYWFEFLEPFHKLTEREISIASTLLKYRYELSKVISDEELLDKISMNEDTRRKVREECEISLPHFQVIMSKLKKNKVIVDGKINPRFIPNIVEEDGNFKLLLIFDFK